MKSALRSTVFFIIFAFVWSQLAIAGVEQLSEQEFRVLAVDLAKKVNLFQDVWSADPVAEFYGGTSRDFLYWVKGKFRAAKTEQDAQIIAEQLRKTPMIDVREFIIGDSDVDVVTRAQLSLDAAHYGIRKFDSISPEIFDPNTELGKNELWQGHIPAEKIRLSISGLSQSAELGDGVKEIYKGELSVHFSEPKKFWSTKYAAAKENHPVLLALRFLRLQAINYFRTHGQEYPELEKLKKGFAGNSEGEVRAVISAAQENLELKPFLDQSRFKTWINATIQKAFRSYTNPTAALKLMEMFHVELFPSLYGEHQIEPIYQYVFQKNRDEKKVAENYNEFSVRPRQLMEPVNQHFPDGFLYHGTKNDTAFRSILFQGVLPSEAGSAGAGLYGVAQSFLPFAIQWAQEKNRVLKLPVKPEAKIVDITKGQGADLWKRYSEKYGDDLEKFAEAFGIDMIRYPYGSTVAYVVKNSAILGHAQGVFRELLTFPKMLEKMKEIRDAKTLVNYFEINQFTSGEVKILLDHTKIPQSELMEALKDLAQNKPLAFLGYTEKSPLLLKNLGTFYPALFGENKKDHTSAYWYSAVRKTLAVYDENNLDDFPNLLAALEKVQGHIGIMNLLEGIEVMQKKKPWPKLKEALLQIIDLKSGAVGISDAIFAVFPGSDLEDKDINEILILFYNTFEMD